MYFKRIEMHGFKSFAEPVVIDFHEGVTCVVGPNGSGKSNISDAIRWVLGEQSPKALRGSKMEEVIFAGTLNRKSRGMAEVTLVIDNSTGILPIDYNEVAITRRMYRSGESEYLINNNQCRLRDIKELIMDTGIGVDGYSIIGQGKISDIVSNKPESRREIFEEAAGVVLYKSKKSDTERKMENASINLERVNDIIGEIEKRIDGLRADSIKAKEFIKLREKYRELEINLTLRNIERIEGSNESIKEDVKNLQASIERGQEEKKKIDQLLSEKRQRSETLEQLGNESRDKLLVKIEEINKLTNKSQLDSERISTIDRDIARINTEIQNLIEKLQTEQDKSTEMNKDFSRISVDLDNKKLELTSKINKYNEEYSKLLDIQNSIEDIKNIILKTHNEISDKRAEIKSMDSYLSVLDRQENELVNQSEQKENNSKAYQEEECKLLSEKNKLQEDFKGIELSIEKQKKDFFDISKRLRELSAEIENLKINKSQTASRMKTLEEMESNYEGYNGAARFIMKAQLKGILGLVSDLMTVPRGYEIAIETALGASLQNVVCEKDQDAKDAINLLKNNKAGRLTFLPLQSVKGSLAKADSIKSQLGFKGMAYDIVSYDGKYQGIFAQLLGRVAIVDTMDNAIKISKLSNGLRIVTLDGEIINSTGAITGGKYKNSTANLLSRKSEVLSLQKKVSEYAESLKINESLKNDLVSEQEKSQTLGDSLKEQLSSIRLGIAQANASLSKLAEDKKNLEESQVKREKELAKILKDKENAKELISNLNEEINELEAEIENTNNLVNENMTKAEIKKAACEAASEEITSARISMTDLSNKKDNTSQMLKIVEANVSELTADIAFREDTILKLKDEKNSIMFSSEDVEELYKTKNSEKEELEAYIEAVTEEKNKLSIEMGTMSQQQNSLGESLNSYQDQKYQQEIKFAKNEAQFETLKERLWEEFELSLAQAKEIRTEDFVVSTASKESRDIKNRIKELGDVNVGSIKEYEQESERLKFLTEQRFDIESAIEELKAIIEDLDVTIRKKFKDNFDQVVINFEAIFKELFGGGTAELRLDNDDNPLEAGIEIIAQPPGKKLQNINLMSGGEKTMTAIALMFAVLKTKPTPFCILDEVEAALDDSNIDRFANYLRNFHEIQFTIVTHQKKTMEHADVLYGVTMPEQGISKVLSLRLGDDFDAI